MDTFANALRRERVRVDLTQDELGDRIGLTGARISQLESGLRPPQVDIVFRIETALGLAPGRLSGLLGYVPVGTVPDVETAIATDDRLDDHAREALLAVYRSLVEKPKKRNR